MQTTGQTHKCGVNIGGNTLQKKLWKSSIRANKRVILSRKFASLFLRMIIIIIPTTSVKNNK